MAGWPWELPPEVSGGEQGCVMFLGCQVDFLICFAERWFFFKSQVMGDDFLVGWVESHSLHLPPQTGLKRAVRSREFTMRRSYSCSVFHDKPTVAGQMGYTALYHGISWCNCRHREFETECARKSCWGLWRSINLVSSHCIDGEYCGQCSYLL